MSTNMEGLLELQALRRNCFFVFYCYREFSSNSKQAIRTWKQSRNKWDTRKPGEYMRMYINIAQTRTSVYIFFFSLFTCKILYGVIIVFGESIFVVWCPHIISKGVNMFITNVIF